MDLIIKRKFVPIPALVFARKHMAGMSGSGGEVGAYKLHHTTPHYISPHNIHPIRSPLRRQGLGLKRVGKYISSQKRHEF
jgi:hypothetical protein